VDPTSPVDDQHLTLDELCERAGVTVRTVRYYISEGLLPPPTGGGPAARYGNEHLDRLAIISELKDRYLPLREIRRTLDQMSSADITATATHLPAAPPAATFAAPVARQVREPTPADDYIAGVLGQQHSRSRSTPRASPVPDDRSWKRLTISGEAELVIDEELWNRRREQVESLVTWARRVLNGS
jgi:DNA-binding transcriptional MerR regulator